MRFAMLSIPLAAALSFASMAANAAPKTPSVPAGIVSITLPPTQGEFKDAPGANLATARCLVCHSAEYVYTQPPLSRATWTAEVKKMKAVYGATFIDDADIAPLVDYLVGQNGKP